MKTTYTLILSGLLVIAMSGVYADFAGAAARDYCYIQARTRDMYVIVYEEDRRGNKEGEIWKGRSAAMLPDYVSEGLRSRRHETFSERIYI
jgi:hypothetical protein